MEVSYTQPGNILVEAPNGSVNAGAGGILQLLLNGPPLPESTTLFGLPLNHNALAKMFNWALTGKTKAALDLQKTLNGNPGNSAVDVFAGYELQQLAVSLTPAEVLAGDRLQNLPVGLQEVADKNGNLIELAFSLTPAEVKAGDTLQNIPSDLQFVVDNVVDKNGNPIINGIPIINALNLSDGTVVRTSDKQEITATGSGVIGAGSVTLKAGDITGNIFTTGNLNIDAVNAVNVNALSGGIATVSGSSLGTSTIAGVGGINAVGDTGATTLMSNEQVSGGQNSMATGTAANAASQGEASEASDNLAKNTDTSTTDDDEKKKKGKAVLVQKTGRVTVILPPRQQSKVQTPEPRT
jgi:hypothetical protein